MKNIFKIAALCFSFVVISSFNIVDFGVGRYKIKGKVYFDNALLKNDTIFFLPFFNNNQPDFENREKIYVDFEGNYEKLIKFTIPCFSGGQSENNKRLSNEEYVKSFFKGNNYKYIGISRRQKSFQYKMISDAIKIFNKRPIDSLYTINMDIVLR
jgi:hypothetical protein